ncbi:MAG: hemolysin family protein [Candidatus Ratteibacteria bacterium]|nr:hemolysin family protein [Candidatus Ratteibacteria bacterium]
MEFFGFLTAVFLCIIFAGFFSGAEIGIISLNRLRLRSLADFKVKRALLLKEFLQNPEYFLSSTLVGTNLAVVIASALATSWAVKYFAAQGALIATVILTPLILIFSEIIPKTLFRQHADRIVMAISPMLKLSFILLSPLVKTISLFPQLLLKPFGGQKTTKSPFVSKEELKFLVEESVREGVVEPGERRMIYHIFDFGATLARDIMETLVNVTAFEINTSLSRVKEIAGGRKFSRYPVYKGRKENVIGLLNIYDLLYEQDNNKTMLGDFIRPVFSVLENTPIDRLLSQLRKERQVMALVINQAGRPLGIVTIEDILEEIVGEI